MGFMQLAQGARVRTVRKYYDDDSTFWDLAVLTIVTTVFDYHLLYPVLGDSAAVDLTERQSKFSKTDILLDRHGTRIGACLFEFKRLLGPCWSQDSPARMPRSMLDVVGAPLTDDGFMKPSRGAMLRLATSTFRRYEVKYSTWPYKMYKMIDSGAADDEKQRVAQSLLDAPGKQLDIYNFGIRSQVDTVPELPGPRRRSISAADFKNHPHDIANIERTNSELAAYQRKRARGRSSVHVAREQIVREALRVHLDRNGLHPLSPSSQANLPAEESVELAPFICEGGGNSGPVLFARQGVSSSELLALGGASDAPSSSSAPASRPTSRENEVFMAPLVVQRPSAALPAAPAGQAARSSADAAGHPRRRVGLNPFTPARNKHLQAAKLAKGRTLTCEELASAKGGFRADWVERGERDGGHDVDRSVYDEWRDDPPDDLGKQSGQVKPYVASWNCGCQATPISKQEFHRHVVQHGWPSDGVICDGGASNHIFKPDETVDFDKWEDYEFWGVGRLARNVSKDGVGDVVKFERVEKHIFSHISNLGKKKADDGTKLIMIEGDTLTEPVSKQRFFAFITGTCYNPKIFDVINCNYHEDDVDLFAAPETCMISDQFEVLDCQTSDEFILKIVGVLRSASLCSFEYIAFDGFDRSLMWPRVDGKKFISNIFVPERSWPAPSRERGQKRKSAIAKLVAAGAGGEQGEEAAQLGEGLAQGAGSEAARQEAAEQDHFEHLGLDCGSADALVGRGLGIDGGELKPADVEELAGGRGAAIDEAGAGDEVDGGGRGAGPAGLEGGAGAAGHGPAPPPPPPEPWEEVGPPSGAGHLYRGTKMVGRLVKSKTKGGVHVTCYMHKRCNLMIGDRLCPGDEVIKRWLFEVETASPTASAEERKALAARHVRLAKDRWQTARGRAAK
ncbi:unnamed protein product [Prorocentrum cordatum]|uniref:Uncharacterized protein n=1 Tax=Prorocentrum cordatum TaxID=2364126 RepID=A0ABN9TJR1_9DINO|nr:unnamed protein product [Polarella glacialis]